MKKFVSYFIIFIFVFQQNAANAQTLKIRKYIPIQKVYDVKKKKWIVVCNDKTLSFQENQECIKNNINTEKEFSFYTKKQQMEFLNLLSIGQAYQEALDKNYIDEVKAKLLWKKLLNSKWIRHEKKFRGYSQNKIKKNELRKTVKKSKCTNITEYEAFIFCFYDEFRNYRIYKTSDILTKERIEHIVINSLALIKEEGRVATLKKLDWDEFDRIYEHGEGFEFFYTLMDGLGNGYFKKAEYLESDGILTSEDISLKRIITFIIIAVVISFVARGVLSKVLKKGGSSSASGASSSASSGATSGASSSLSTSGVAAKGAYGTNMFRFAPATSVLRKSWFRYGIARGGFF